MSHTSRVRLGGLVLGTGDPRRLNAWYHRVFAPTAEAGPRTAIEFDGGRVIFDHRDDLAAAPREPGRILINVYVEDVRAVEAHLKTVGVEWVRPVESEPFGTIGTVKDPDGNYVQVIQLADPRQAGF